MVVLYTDKMQEIVEEAFSKLMREKSEFQAKGSGWTPAAVIGMELWINKYNPLRGSTFIELPAKIKNTKAVINVKNKDQYCFKYATWAKNIERDPQSVSKYNTQACHMGYNWDCIAYPVELKDIPKFERANNISINVFGLTDKNLVYPLKIVDHELEDHRDLLYISNEITAHQCRIRNFDKLIHSQITKHCNGIFTCKRCLTYYQNECKLEEHQQLSKGIRNLGNAGS
ncbi:uncharacterized protein [Hetaerina americana]|uniref:uncharacterized protein n=1 Tax=Hetaerina americana TaxID=62018 RepID=UPI003A7F5A59